MLIKVDSCEKYKRLRTVAVPSSINYHKLMKNARTYKASKA